MEIQTISRRLRAYLISNGSSVLSTLPVLYFNLSENSSFLQWYGSSVFRLGFISILLGTIAPKRLNELDDKTIKEPSNFEVICRLLFVAAPLEAFMTIIAIKNFVKSNTSWKKFLLLSFVFEIFLDFGHYLAHRLVHTNSFLYRVSGHKTHHAVHKPTAIATFCQDPIDVILSNVFPVLSSLYIMDRFFNMNFTKEQLLVAFGFKTYVEVAGHVGVLDGHATSFPQFVWLPRWLGIQLHTRDHDLHHTHGGKHNFSKRFILFDKVFGTYKEHPIMKSS